MFVRLGHLVPLAVTVHSLIFRHPVVPIVIENELLSRHSNATLGRHGTTQPAARAPGHNDASCYDSATTAQRTT
jgi:hypothetical protein